MTISELAKDFTELLKQGDDEGAAKRYNANDTVSYEAKAGPMSVCRGMEAVKQKGDWWRENHEVHGGSAEGPYVNWDQFAVRFKMDVHAQVDRRAHYDGRGWALYGQRRQDYRRALLLSSFRL